MDEDLAGTSREALITQVKRLRADVREHRGDANRALRRHHPQLWGLVSERTDLQPQRAHCVY